MRPAYYLPVLILALCALSCNKEEDAGSSAGNWAIGWVRTEDAQFVDEAGRVLQLRGINQRVNGLFDASFTDGRTANEIVPEITQADIDSIARLGFNFLRLPINWSGYEPERDAVNPDYIPRILDVVRWCKAAGIYVQIDWHFDAYSKEIGEDGAPYWAMKFLPNPRWEGPLNFTTLAIRRANPWVFENYAFLFRNGNGIRDEFMDAWADVIRALKDDPAVIGFEPLNEPTAYFGGISESAFLDFYKECSQRLRAIDNRHLLWLEPDAARNVFDQAPLLKEPFPDDQVVYCPHYYPNLLQGASYPTVEQWVRNTNKSFNRIVEEGRSWNAPVVINEWGINPTTTSGKALVVAYRQQMEDRNLHGAYWLWKEHPPGTSGTDGTWGFFDDLGGGNWQLREDAVRNFVVPYAMATPGPYSNHRFDPATRELTCTFTYNRSGANPILYIPPHTYPEGFDILLDGKPATYTADGYHRYGIQWVPANGTHSLTVRPK